MAWFEGGVTVSHINVREAYALGSYIHVVEIDADGNELGQVSHAVDMVKRQEVTAPVVKPRERLSDIQAREAAEAEEAKTAIEATGETVWTREALEEVGTSKGIAGIRAIADPMGIKGVSMRNMISEILARQPGN